MKKNILFSTLFGLAGLVLAADPSPKDDVMAATKKLADKGSYSWKSSMDLGPNSQFQISPTEAKIDKEGTIWLSFATRDGATIQGIKKGSKIAIKTDQGWQAGSADAGGGGGFGDPVVGGTRRLQNLKAPAAEVEDLISKVKDLKKDGDAFSGELTEDGAKSLVTMGGFGRRGGGGGGGGGNAPAAKNAKGSVKFWVKDGVLSKYESKVQGTVTGRDGEDRDIERSTTVELKDVGTTKIEVPEEAQKKLS
jgi:hypothetical protein